jgi:uncharacterized protein (DUF1501 family)
MATYRTSRRRFLVQVGAAVAGGATTPLWLDLVSGKLPWAWGAGETDVLPTGTPICVHIAMDGGNDYLNTLVPINDGWYRDTAAGHGAIALTQAETLALTGSTYRLHGSLGWLADRWNNVGDVGFALGVGNPLENFSHFDSMKYWETGRLDVLGKTGWLGRYADTVRPQNPLASVAISDLRQDAIGGTAPVLVVQDCAGFTYEPPWLSSDQFMVGAKQMATIPGTNTVADVARMMGTTFQVADRISKADDATLTGDSSGYSGLEWITQQLVQTALLIKAGIPAQSYTMGFGPFDSHGGQKQMQIDRFTELNQALSKFFAVLAGHAREHDVFVLVTSEFGRQATANEDAGTDHGQAGMAMFIGGGVKRGVFGDAPTLDPAKRIDDAIKPTVDFRTVHATALNRLAKGDTNVADSVLGAHFEDLALFNPIGTPPPTTTTSTTVVPPSTTTSTTRPPTTTSTTRPPTTTTTTVANKKPVPMMRLSATTGRAPLTITADASGSADPDGTITKYTWRFGDGTAAVVGKVVTHKFTKRGSFTVKLVVQDNKGATATKAMIVKVT